MVAREVGVAWEGMKKGEGQKLFCLHRNATSTGRVVEKKDFKTSPSRTSRPGWCSAREVSGHAA